MLQPILEALNCKKIILASTSPRRKMLLENIGIKFDIVPSRFEENLSKEGFGRPVDYVIETAKQKTLDVVHRLYNEQGTPPDLIIGADTIVSMDNDIIEKPSSRQHAIDILSRLSGCSHTVYTAVVLVTPSKESGRQYDVWEFCEDTKVNMGCLSQKMIEAYVDTGEPMDKAGGYGIQALGSTIISGIQGDYFNVIGFPLHPFAKLLLQIFPDG